MIHDSDDNDPKVIDLQRFAERRARDEEGYFSVAGSVEGERSRWTLPIWRAIHALQGDRGAVLLWGEDGTLTPCFILDLGAEPARMDFEGAVPRTSKPGMWVRDAEDRGRALISLGEAGGNHWLLGVTGISLHPDSSDRSERIGMSERRRRAGFYAGEVAALLVEHGLVDGLGPVVSEEGDQDP